MSTSATLILATFSCLLRYGALAFAIVITAGASSSMAQLYGTGADGNHTVAGIEDISSNKNYNNLTIPAGAILETRGFDVRVNGILTNAGTIRDTITGGQGGNGGPPGDGGIIGEGQNGLNGTAGQSGPVGTGNGGPGGGSGGGGGGAWDSAQFVVAPGGNGGDGGDGGRGGGKVRVYAREIINTGSINANGVSGWDGFPGDSGTYTTYVEGVWPITFDRDFAGGGGGGGAGGDGGNGGSVVVTYAIPTMPGSITANGGPGGSGGSGGAGPNTIETTGFFAVKAHGGLGGSPAASGGEGGWSEVDATGAENGSSGQPGATGTPGSVTLQQSTLCYTDSDGDGFGDASDNGTDVVGGCTGGVSTNNLDCDDGDAGVNPNEAEVCFNGIDDNCDGEIDENCCPITLTGDVNASMALTSADIIYLVIYVFKSGADPLPCVAMGDVNCTGTVTSADIIHMVIHVFKAGLRHATSVPWFRVRGVVHSRV